MGLLDETTGLAYYNGSDFGNYQFTSLQNIIDQFIIAYVGENKIISKINRLDVVFHAKRALQELSFDTFKCTKAYEVEIPATLKMPLPQDYVNYVKLSWSDGAGIEHVLYPAAKTSNPSNISQTDTPGVAPFYNFTNSELVLNTDSDTLTNFSSTNTNSVQSDLDYDDDVYDFIIGQRYGIDPQYAQVNGSFYIDDIRGFIHFSSNISGKTVILKYISDSLGTDAEMQVHKFAEEAMYKNIAYAIMSTRSNVPQNLVMRLRREAFAAKRQAKLRLSNIKLEEITQIFRGKSKHIKH
tara:strand:- start:2307 stop:3194 length:888 start_codon:yes stop_codon:yes gene_type:complete